MKHFATVMLGFGIVLAALPAARAADTTCPPAPSPGSTVNGNLIVPTGPSCNLEGVTVTGNVQVQPNTGLTMYLGVSAGGAIIASKIEGNLTVGSGALVNFYGSGQDPSWTQRIGGNVTADHCDGLSLGTGTIGKDSNPAVVVGGNVLIQYCNNVNETDNTEIGGNFTCNSTSYFCALTFSNIKGNVVFNNNGQAEVFDNTVGGNVVFNNNGSANGSAYVGGNTIGGNLQCQGNTSIIGSGNMVGGNKTGQCANF